MSQPPTRPGGGMSGLYANLLGRDTSSSATISKAPVVFAEPTGGVSASPSPDTSNPTTTTTGANTQKKINAAALRFQPTITKRPALSQKKGMSFKPIGAFSTPKGDDAAPAKAEAPKPVVKTTLEDWVGDDEDVNGFYNTSRDRPRSGRKKRRKNKATPPPPTNWDDIYDPLRPNSYEEYKEGDEKIREMEDWRERLYGKKRAPRYDDSSESEDDRRRPMIGGRFAPPTNYSFAPPPQFAPTQDSALPPPPPPPVEVPNDASGEDAFARRMRMSQQGQIGYAAAVQPPPLPPPPPLAQPTPPPPAPDATISRAPVLYQQPSKTSPSPTDPINTYPGPEQESFPPEPSSRPGQAGFAKRLMEKQGWKAGQGLGRDGSGITKAIQMVSSGKKGQPGRGRIVDKNKPRVDPSALERSEVVVMHGIIDGKRHTDHGELLQKIGDEYKRYGRVVQIVVKWEEAEEEGEEEERARVYVLFADVGSALMAVNGLQRREIFEGNTTQAEFYPKEKFEAMVFD